MNFNPSPFLPVPATRAGRLAMVLLLLMAPCLWAQRPDGTPLGRLPTSPRILPPASPDASSAGTGKFVLFVRQESGANSEGESTAGAWECIPSRPDLPVTQRLDFGQTTDYARPLLGPLVPGDARDRFPRFVVLRRSHEQPPGAATLYDIDYRTWETRTLGSFTDLKTLGLLGHRILCSDAQGPFQVDGHTGELDRSPALLPLEFNGRHWQVQKADDPGAVWSYDPLRDQLIQRFEALPPMASGIQQSWLSPDGRIRTSVIVKSPRDHWWRPWTDRVPLLRWEPGQVRGSLLVQRGGAGRNLRVPITVYGFPRADRDIYGIGARLDYEGNHTVVYSAALDAGNPVERVWTVEIATGAVTNHLRPVPAEPTKDLSVIDGVPTPGYLRPILERIPHATRDSVVFAFLIHHGLLKEAPDWFECSTGISPDGRHVLFHAKEGPLADEFIYGDLQTRQIRRWPRPREIAPDDWIRCVWVETP